MQPPVFEPKNANTPSRRYQRDKDFLSDMISEEVQQKLNDHNREFKKIAIIAKQADEWARELSLDADAIVPKDTLHFPADDYDLILHLDNMHRATDVVGQMVQPRLNMSPDGVFIAAFLGGESLAELRASLLHADIAVYGGASPRVAPMIDLRDAGSLMGRAGLALPVADHWPVSATYDGLTALSNDLRALGRTNPLSARRKSFTTRDFFNEAEKYYRKNYTCDDGKIYATYELIFLTGYAPSSDQPKALRPGSVSISLAEALAKSKENL